MASPTLGVWAPFPAPGEDLCKGRGTLHFSASGPPDGHAAWSASRSAQVLPQQSLQDCAEEKLGVYSQDILGALLYRGLCYLRVTVPSLGKRLCTEEIKKPVVFVE